MSVQRHRVGRWIAAITLLIAAGAMLLDDASRGRRGVSPEVAASGAGESATTSSLQPEAVLPSTRRSPLALEEPLAVSSPEGRESVGRVLVLEAESRRALPQSEWVVTPIGSLASDSPPPARRVVTGADGTFALAPASYVIVPLDRAFVVDRAPVDVAADQVAVLYASRAADRTMRIVDASGAPVEGASLVSIRQRVGADGSSAGWPRDVSAGELARSGADGIVWWIQEQPFPLRLTILADGFEARSVRAIHAADLPESIVLERDVAPVCRLQLVREDDRSPVQGASVTGQFEVAAWRSDADGFIDVPARLLRGEALAIRDPSGLEFTWGCNPESTSIELPAVASVRVDFVAAAEALADTSAKAKQRAWTFGWSVADEPDAEAEEDASSSLAILPPRAVTLSLEEGGCVAALPIGIPLRLWVSSPLGVGFLSTTIARSTDRIAVELGATHRVLRVAVVGAGDEMLSSQAVVDYGLDHDLVFESLDGEVRLPDADRVESFVVRARGFIPRRFIPSEEESLAKDGQFSISLEPEAAAEVRVHTPEGEPLSAIAMRARHARDDSAVAIDPDLGGAIRTRHPGWNESPPATVFAVTDGRGIARLRGVPAAPHKLGLDVAPRGGERVVSFARTLDRTVDFAVTPSIDWALVPPRTISLAVVDVTSGVPLRGFAIASPWSIAGAPLQVSGSDWSGVLPGEADHVVVSSRGFRTERVAIAPPEPNTPTRLVVRMIPEHPTRIALCGSDGKSFERAVRFEVSRVDPASGVRFVVWSGALPLDAYGERSLSLPYGSEVDLRVVIDSTAPLAIDPPHLPWVNGGELRFTVREP